MIWSYGPSVAMVWKDAVDGEVTTWSDDEWVEAAATAGTSVRMDDALGWNRVHAAVASTSAPVGADCALHVAT